MSKNKEHSSSKKEEGDDFLTSYLNMKSPLMGHLEFDVSVLPPPVDPKFLDYEINKDLVNYELTGLEFSERLSNFSDFSAGLSDSLLQGTSFTGCGIENQELMESLESKFLNNLTSAKRDDSYLHRVRDDVLETMRSFEDLKMSNLLSKAKESLPNYLQNLFSSNLDATFIDHKKVKYFRKEESTEDLRQPAYESWDKMSLDERVEAYVSELENTFVDPDQLVHPTNKFLKKLKVFDVLPNMTLWSNKYIQVGIDGVTVNSDSHSKLDVDGVLKLSKETQTQRFFEYYKKHLDVTPTSSFSSSSDADLNHRAKEELEHAVKEEVVDDIDDLFNDEPSGEGDGVESPEKEEEGDLYKFIRQYTSQKVSKSAGTENYYLLRIPERLHNQVTNAKVKGEARDGLDAVELVPIRGPKLVFSKAGVTKRPDIRIAYVKS